MKINEVTQAKVSRASGNEVEIDHGDGTKTTVDTKKNPNAITRDEQGKVKVDTSRNSAMRNNKSKKPPRPGEQVEIKDE